MIDSCRNPKYLITEPPAHGSLSLEQDPGELVDEGAQRGEGVSLHRLRLTRLQEVQVEREDLLHRRVVSVALPLHLILQCIKGHAGNCVHGQGSLTHPSFIQCSSTD